MNEVVTINTDNYATMAKAMGVPTMSTDKKTNVLNRFRLWHNPTMGKDTNSQGKEIITEVVEGGSYRLEEVGDPSKFFFAKKVKFRPFMQRFMYKRYTAYSNPKEGEKRGFYTSSIMADNLNIDLKDDAGTFNCGKPAGFVEDFQALSETVKKSIREIKRYRVVFGIVDLLQPIKAVDGKEVDEKLSSFPVIWEVNNRDDYKALGGVFSKFAKMERLPLQHNIDLEDPTPHKGNSGNTFYTSNVKLDLTSKIDISEEDHKIFGDFMDWVKVHNDGIIAKWDSAVAERQDVLSHDDMKTVDDFIDVELESANA